MTSQTIADHLITTLAAHGITARLAHETVDYGLMGEVTFSTVTAKTATGQLSIFGATSINEESDDYCPTYDVDYTPDLHAAYQAEHTSHDGTTEVYWSEGQRLSLTDDTTALMAAVAPYFPHAH